MSQAVCFNSTQLTLIMIRLDLVDYSRDTRTRAAHYGTDETSDLSQTRELESNR